MQKRDGKSFFMMRGHLGQYVIVEPEDNIIIVRLGHQKSPDAANQIFSDDISIYIEEAYKMLNDDLQNQS
jgi:CubicO group peptidase (beta-lactamase class C family)